jgi:hypothetical protein
MNRYTFNLIPAIEYYKGGGGYVPPPPDPMREAEAREWQSSQQAARDKQQRDYEAEQARLQKEKDITASRERVSRGYDDAMRYGTSTLGARGVQGQYADQVSNLYRAALDRARGGAPEIVNDASTLFTPTLFDDAYGTVRSTARSGLNKNLDEFMGNGFEYNAFQDTADDDYINSILGDQKTEAQAALDRAKARGQINEVGYATGQKELGNQEIAGRAKANQLGLGVLSNYRKGLGDYNTSQRTRVDNFDLGDSFDVGGVKSRFDQTLGGYKGSMQGDILAALGGQNFFNTDTLVGKAGNASGVTNNSPTSPTQQTGLLGQPIGKTTAASGNLGGTTNQNQVF